MTSAAGAQADRQLLRVSGALLLGGFVVATAVTVLFHPGGDIQRSAVPALQVAVLVFAIGVVVTAARGRAGEAAVR